MDQITAVMIIVLVFIWSIGGTFFFLHLMNKILKEEIGKAYWTTTPSQDFHNFLSKNTFKRAVLGICCGLVLWLCLLAYIVFIVIAWLIDNVIMGFVDKVELFIK